MAAARNLAAIAVVAFSALSASAARIVTLDEKNWNLVPAGKEVDAIYGDFLMKNDKVVVVIGSTLFNRQLNLRISSAQGSVVDFALLSSNNDQLTVFHPHAYVGDGPAADRAEVIKPDGAEVTLRVTRKATAESPVEVVTDYTLKDGDQHLKIVTTRRNTSDKPAKVRLTDRLFHEKPAVFSEVGQHLLVASLDRYFGMSYGLVRTDGKPMNIAGSTPASRTGTGLIDYSDLITKGAGPGGAELAPGQSLVLSRLLVAGDDLASMQRTAMAALQAPVRTSIAATVTDDTSKPLARVSVGVYRAADWEGVTPAARKDLTPVSFGFTGADGRTLLPVPPGKYAVSIEDPGRIPVVKTLEIAADATSAAELKASIGDVSRVAFDVTDESGASSPVKVQFIGAGNTPNPDLGPDQRADGCRNLWFSVKGRFEVPLPPGDYYVLLSRGPEYDVAWRTLSLAPGRKALVSARLPRVVDTRGWISADFHNHSTPSGDNSTQVEGRLACLIAEGIEFGAATEHQRIMSYKPYLEAMGAAKLMATSDGMELTSTPLPLMHLNAFPLHAHPHTQFGGGPLVDKDPLVQIKRLKDHDSGSDKLMQQNHPDIGWLVYDKDGDGKPDEGFGTLPYTDVVEIWTTTILAQKPKLTRRGNVINDRMFNWLQLLNQGHRLPGVANTDAHVCFHDSGVIRNWVKSDTDVPAEIKEMDVVHASRKGRLIISNGPFLDVSLIGGDAGKAAIPGDDIRISGDGKLKVRVQCPNWFDVNRVQVLMNGKPDPTLNFTRQTHQAMFADGVVKFEQELAVKFPADAHVMVVATGENSSIGPVMGADAQPPMAISNPIYVDADGNGFKANGDTLGSPLPVKAQ